jgi:hypothetical protein
MNDLLIYLFLGSFAGLIAGLLGVGGGIVVVPALVLAFRHQGINDEILMHLALGTSLATIVVTTLSAVRAHHRRGAVQWALVRRLAPALLIGALAGSWLADAISGRWLTRLFGLLALAVSVQMLLNRQPSAGHHRGGAETTAVGLGIGVLSALTGIGGGTVMVPYLMWSRTAAQQAVATSSACGLPIALAGASGFVVAGYGNAALPQASLGYVYLPAFLGIVALSIVFAPLGARLAHWLPAGRLKKVFALFLGAVGLQMLFRT